MNKNGTYASNCGPWFQWNANTMKCAGRLVILIFMDCRKLKFSIGLLIVIIVFILIDTFFVVADIDECSLKTDGCSKFASCKNTNGGYNCRCVRSDSLAMDSTVQVTEKNKEKKDAKEIA